MNPENLDLHSSDVGALPIVRHFMDRIGLDAIFEKHVSSKDLGRPAKISTGRMMSLMVSNFLLSRLPLYAMSDWAARFRPELFDLDALDASVLNDDRLGRALQQIYDSEQAATLLTAIVTKVVREFEIDLDQIHNDTTTVTMTGAYDNQKEEDGEEDRPPLITFGHNKDHRPDLKQLVYSLTITADGAVPVHYRCYDGNTSDDQTHQDTWTTVRAIRGGADFMYVADSKLCTRENMSFIADQGGRFLTVLPRTRREHDEFCERVRQSGVSWVFLTRRKSRRSKDSLDQVYEFVDEAAVTSDGYRLIWYRSSVKAAIDEDRRYKKIMRAKRRLAQLAGRTGAHAFRTMERARAAGEKILEEEGAKAWIRFSLSEEPRVEMKRVPHTPITMNLHRPVPLTPAIIFQVHENVEAIAADAKLDGVFAMVSNDRTASAEKLLGIYKYQPFLEKRNEQLKSVLTVAPVFLKNAERFPGLLFLYYVAVLIFALIEREIREAMKRAGIKSLPLYPEGRHTKAPTADLVMRHLEEKRRHELRDDKGVVIRVFHDPVSELEKKVVDLLGVPRHHYGA